MTGAVEALPRSDWLTAEECAAVIGRSPHSLKHIVNQGKLHPVKARREATTASGKRCVVHVLMFPRAEAEALRAELVEADAERRERTRPTPVGQGLTRKPRHRRGGAKRPLPPVLWEGTEERDGETYTVRVFKSQPAVSQQSHVGSRKVRSLG